MINKKNKVKPKRPSKYTERREVFKASLDATIRATADLSQVSKSNFEDGYLIAILGVLLKFADFYRSVDRDS